MNALHGQYLHINTNGGCVSELPKKGSALLRILLRDQGFINATKSRNKKKAEFMASNKRDIALALHVLSELDNKDESGFLPDSICEAVEDLQKIINVNNH